jgi:DNA-binding transcriptional LysR family regulator
MQLTDLEVRHLVALDAVASTGTFGRAAERLGYTQSAVSQQIAALERLVGAKLFDRPGGPRPVELTPLGRQVLDSARDLIARVEAMGQDLDRFQHGEAGRLIVGTFQSVSARVLPMVVARMRSEYPDVEIRVQESDLDNDLVESLRRGQLDLSFMVGDMADGFDSHELLLDPFVLVARPGQFPAGPVSLKRLAQEPMIGQHANSCQLMNEQAWRSAGFEPNYVFRTNDNATVAAMVRAGLGVAVLPQLCVDPNDPTITVHPLRPKFPDRRISLAWRSGRTLSPVAERFIDTALEVAAECLQRRATADVA